MIDIGFRPTFPETLHRYTRRYADREFLVEGDKRITFGEFERKSAELARGMLASGIGKGTRVGIVLPDGIDWITAFTAAARIGAFCIPFSTLSQARELRWLVQYADIDTLIIADRYMKHDYIDRLEECFPDLSGQTGAPLAVADAPYLRRIVVWGDCDRSWALPGPGYFTDCAAAMPRIDDDFLGRVEENVTPADLLLMIFTSGTTSNPKGVPHTHGGVIRHSHALLESCYFDDGDRLLPQMPLFWIGGLNVTLFPSLYRGVTMVFPETKDLGEALNLIEREKITRLMVWPQQLAGLMAHPAYSEERVKTLKPSFMSPFPPRDENGEPWPRERRAMGFGLSETFGTHTQYPADQLVPPGHEGAYGQPIEGIEAKIVDPETGETLGPNQAGELLVRGYALTPGLYKFERHEVFEADGFYRTGDLCSLDEENFLFFHGRRGDMVKTMGANVSPREVEAVLESLPEIKEAAVIGLPDEELGEKLVAVVVPAPGATPAEESLKATLKNELSAYKVPRRIVFRRYDEMPRTAGTKVHKRRLKEELLAESL